MLDILFEDQDMIVINKPAGVLSIPDRFGKEHSIKSQLQQIPTPGIHHQSRKCTQTEK